MYRIVNSSIYIYIYIPVFDLTNLFFKGVISIQFGIFANRSYVFSSKSPMNRSAMAGNNNNIKETNNMVKVRR